jgi:ribosome-interacting GTPase 1
VYTKPKGKLPDFNEPVVLHRSQATIEGFCNKIHKTLLKQLKYANVWGSSAKHRPQKVGKDHELQDEDIVQVGGGCSVFSGGGMHGGCMLAGGW